MRPREPLDTGPPATDWKPQDRPFLSATRRPIPAGLLSLILHVSCLLLVLSLFGFKQPTGASLQETRSGGIVLVQSRGEQPQYFDAAQSSSAETDRASESEQLNQASSRDLAAPLSLATDLSLPGNLPAPDASLSGSEERVELPSATGLLQGDSQKPAGDAVQTGVFGVKGTGTRFVYVFDRSGSMAGFQGRPLASAKAQLLASLNDLGSNHQFQIIFFSNQPAMFQPRSKETARMFFADDATKRIAESWIRGVVADGSTRHLEALLMALRMRPEVIFFLTDAAEPRMTLREVEKVNVSNQRVGASIHTIEFGAGPFQEDNNFLVRLAQANRGHYSYVDITRLSRQP